MSQEAGSPRPRVCRSLPLDFPVCRITRSARLLTLSHSGRGVLSERSEGLRPVFKDGVKPEEPSRLATHRKHLERCTSAFREKVKAESGGPTKPVLGDNYLLRRKNFPRGSYV